MRQAEAKSLEKVIDEAIEGSSLAARYHGLRIGMPGIDEDVMRIHLSFDNLGDVDERDLSNLVRAIEDAVLVIDDRYPSVRFAEAA